METEAQRPLEDGENEFSEPGLPIKPIESQVNADKFSEPGLAEEPIENQVKEEEGARFVSGVIEEEKEEEFDLSTREGIEKRYEKRMQDIKNLQGAIAREVGCSLEELRKNIRINPNYANRNIKYIKGQEGYHGEYLIRLLDRLDKKAEEIKKEKELAIQVIFDKLEKKI